MNVYETLSTRELPEDIGQKKLPYYEISLPFQANVPWDFSDQLENARNLKEISDIETKVIAKYEKLRSFLLKGDGINFLREIEESDLRSSSHLYATKEELLEEDKIQNRDVNRSRLDVQNRLVLPIEDFEIKFYAHDKLVVLRQKSNKKSSIRVEYDSLKGEGKYRLSKPIILYMPKGATELKVW